MKHLKRLIAVITLAAFTAIFMTAAAEWDDTSETQADLTAQAEARAYFASFHGIIQEVYPFYDVDGVTAVEGKYFVLVEGEDGQIVNFVVSKDTYQITRETPEAGADITGWYDAMLPALAIYPPQFQAEVIAVGLESGISVEVDFFDGELTGASGNLKIVSTEGAEIILKSGEPYDGALENRRLAVVYDAATFSIPAQTTPIRIVVLPEQPGGGDIPLDVENMDIVVNGEIIEAPSARLTDGVVMVPYRAICEALGFEVGWDGGARCAFLNSGMSAVYIGRDYYTYLRVAPIELGAAPELAEGRTFVPLNYFTDVLRINNAYVFEGQIVIDEGEKME